MAIPLRLSACAAMLCCAVPYLLLASSHLHKYKVEPERGELSSDTSPKHDCLVTLVCGGSPVNAIGITDRNIKVFFFFLFVDTCIAKPHHGFGSISHALP